MRTAQFVVCEPPFLIFFPLLLELPNLLSVNPLFLFFFLTSGTAQAGHLLTALAGVKLSVGAGQWRWSDLPSLLTTPEYHTSMM